MVWNWSRLVFRSPAERMPSPGLVCKRNGPGAVRGPIEQNFAVDNHICKLWVLTAKFCSIGPRTAPGPLRLQTSPGEGILSAGDLKTERLQFQTERLQFQLKSEEMAQPTAWGSG